MDNDVRNSEAAKASHIPFLPRIVGRSMKAGTRNMSPLHSAKTTDGITFSTLWKYPIAVRLNMKNINATENTGNPAMANCAVGSCGFRNSLTN